MNSVQNIKIRQRKGNVHVDLLGHFTLYQSGKTATSLHHANVEHQTIMHSQKVSLSALMAS